MADISRRTLLSRSMLAGGVVIGAAVGFGRHVHHKVAVPPPAPPAELTRALTKQQALLAGYDEVGAAPAGLKADVTAHGDALRALLELYPGWRLAQQPPAGPTNSPATSSPSGTAVPASVAGLATASAALATALTDAVQTWPAADAHAATVVPTLASIAASLSTHVQVLT